MQRYIEQLIEDIHRATWNIQPPHEIWEDADPDNEAELEDLGYVEKFYYGEEKPVYEITGIPTEMLPEAEQLTVEQQSLLAVELEKLLQNFHFHLEFPETFPAHLRYPFIRDFWNENHVAISFGNNDIEFCDMDENVYCPFPGYCTICKEFAEEIKYDEEISKKYKDQEDDIDLPF